MCTWLVLKTLNAGIVFPYWLSINTEFTFLYSWVPFDFNFIYRNGFQIYHCNLGSKVTSQFCSSRYAKWTHKEFSYWRPNLIQNRQSNVAPVTKFVLMYIVMFIEKVLKCCFVIHVAVYDFEIQTTLLNDLCNIAISAWSTGFFLLYNIKPYFRKSYFPLPTKLFACLA